MTMTHLPRSATKLTCPHARTSFRSRSLSTAASTTCRTLGFGRGSNPQPLSSFATSTTTTMTTTTATCIAGTGTGAGTGARTGVSLSYRSAGRVGAKSLCTLSANPAAVASSTKEATTITTRWSAQTWQYPHSCSRLSGPSFLGQARISTLRCTKSTSASNSQAFPQPHNSRQQGSPRRYYGHLTAAVETMPSSARPISMPAKPSISSANGLHSTAFPVQATMTSVSRMSPTAGATVTPATSSPRRRYSPQHFYQNRILDPYVNQPVTPITLRQLVFFGRNMQLDKLLKSANYVRTELPVRLAHRIRDFQNLPFIVGTNPHIELVYDLYWQAFEKLRKVPEIKTLEDNDKFCELVKGLLNDHLVVIPQLALGIMECSKHIPPEQVDQFMNKMLRSRISRRVLAEQHLALTANYNSHNHMMADRGYIGIIYTHCNPRDIVERTALLAAETCRQAFGGELEPPKVILDGNIDAEFAYVPDHIEYILYELLKNSMRFVMLRHECNAQGELPPIQITVCEGTNDIVFRISDRGGGIDPETEKHLWSYAQQSARFANFEKVSKMAATVQEQMVSPSRSSFNNSDGSSGSHNEAEGDVTQVSAGDDEDIVLPPPPPTVHGGSNDHGRPIIQLDRHARERQKQNQQRHKHLSTSVSPVSAAKHASTPEMIDPAQQREPVAVKPGHLDPKMRQSQGVHLGIGLPMSKVYAEYWGGDLKVFTMHGYGTDAYAKFCKFGNIYENFNV